jgi:hypothetical protein
MQMVEQDAKDSCAAQGKKVFIADAKQSGIPLFIESAHAQYLCIGPDDVTHLSTFGADVIWASNLNGVGIVSVTPSSVAEKSGLRPGDVLHEFAGDPVARTGQLESAIERCRWAIRLSSKFVAKGRTQPLPHVSRRVGAQPDPKRSLNGRSGYAVRLMLVVLRPAIQPDMKPGNAKSGCIDPEAAAWSLQANLYGPPQRFQQGMLLFLRSRSKERAQMTVAHAPCLRLGYDKDRVPTNIGKPGDQVRSGGGLQQGQKRCGIRGSPVKQSPLKDDMLVGALQSVPLQWRQLPEEGHKWREAQLGKEESAERFVVDPTIQDLGERDRAPVATQRYPFS